MFKFEAPSFSDGRVSIWLRHNDTLVACGVALGECTKETLALAIKDCVADWKARPITQR
jgi:hypothetical protein